MRFAAVFCLALLAVPLSAEEPPVFPPIGDRYDNLPEDANRVVKALKGLQARTEIGVTYQDYAASVNDVCPEVKVFVDSPEAKSLPELRFLLTNAADCYVKVREIWNESLFADDPLAKRSASRLLEKAQPLLWTAAEVNVSGAVAFMESPKEDLVEAQDALVAGLDGLTLASNLDRITQRQEGLGSRPTANTLEEAPPRKGMGPASRRPAEIDVEESLRVVQSLKDSTDKEVARYANTLIGLTKTSEWSRKAEGEKPIKGRLIKISPEGATFETSTGNVTVRIQELSAASGTTVTRVRDICRRISQMGPEPSGK